MSKSPSNGKSNILRDNPMMSNGNASHRPSVPISVYRELAAELQGNQAQLDALYEKNQKLERYNKQLLQEITAVLESTHHLEQVVRVLDEGEAKKLPSQLPTPIENTPVMASNQASEPSFLSERETTPEPVKQEKSAVRKPQEQKSSQGMNGLLLFMGVTLLALTAFFTGYLVVRPMLNDSPPNQVN